MQFTSRVIVSGAKRFKGEVEKTLHDNTKVFLITQLKTANDGDAVGSATMEYLWGKSDNFTKISGVKMPFEADCDFEQVTTGKISKVMLHDVRPVVPAQAAKA